MSYEFYVWGEISFPSLDAIAEWKTAIVDPSRYSDWNLYFEGKPSTARLSVEEILSEYSDVTTFDGSLCYFLDLDQQQETIRVRGLVHRDGFDRLLLATFRCAADLEGRGDLLFEHSLDGDIYHLQLSVGSSEWTEEDDSASDMDAICQIMDESERRTRPPEKTAKKKTAKKK